MTSYKECGIDIETYSSADLIKYGVYAYTDSPDFEVLLVSYSIDGGEVECIDLTSNDRVEDFLDILRDPHILKNAYNANFERTCLARHFGVECDPDQWRCTAVLAAQLGLPRSLKAVGEALELPEDAAKLKTGKALIDYFCKPCRPTKANGQRLRNFPHHAPDKWELFKEYNKQDVVAEQEIRKRLVKFCPNDFEQALWSIDQRINDRGVRLDLDMAGRIVAHDDARTEALQDEARELTGLSNPNSLAQLKAWLNSQGVKADTLNKADVAAFLASDIPDNVRRVLEIRQSTGLSSIKKYSTMLNMACSDQRCRGMMQFYGGHTGRWAGRGLQPQNLARPDMELSDLNIARDLVKASDWEGVDLLFGDPAPVLSQLVRTAFIPSEGRRFVVSDFGQIEARVLAWIAGEDWRLDVFESGKDIYCESASRMFGVPVVKHGINGELRQQGKVAELALGYGGGVGAIKSMDSKGAIPEENIEGIIQDWRSASPSIVRFWRQSEAAAIKAVKEGRASYRGLIFRREHIDGKVCLRIKLPSGRWICYFDARIEDGAFGEQLSYAHANQTTGKWEQTRTYGGKITENIVQSIARDCLADKMAEVGRRGYEIVFHVHDEMIIDTDREGAVEEIDEIMSEPIEWADGLPLKGDTFECEFYRK